MKLLQRTTKQIRQYNKTGKTAVHNEVHKITNNILRILVSLLKNENSTMQISECLLYQISGKSVEGFMGYMEMSIMTLYKPGFILDQYG
jgi:hypothetical protein